MNRLLRPVIAVVLTLALSAQLVEAQTPACERMRAVVTGTVNNEYAEAHADHARSGATTALLPDDEERGVVLSTDCLLAGSCMTPAAVPVDAVRQDLGQQNSSVCPLCGRSVPSRTSRPDLPPPRG